MLIRIDLAPVWRIEAGGQVLPAHARPFAIVDGHGTASGAGQDWTHGFLGAEEIARLLERAYLRGEDNPASRIDGSYAYVVIDGERRRIIAGRDPIGKGQLFYTQTGPSSLLLATSLETLLDCAGHDGLDHDYLADVLASSWHLGTRTPFSGISRIAPGSALHWPEHKTTRNFWRGWRPAPISDLRTGEAYVERLRTLLAAAVASNSADVPDGALGCELSGGLDSSTIYRLASRSRTVSSFSYVFPQSAEANEDRFIAAALDNDRSRWFAMDADEAAPFTEILPVPLAEPGSAQIYAAWHRRFAEATAQAGARTILTGLAGDSLFFGDRARPLFIADMLRMGRGVSAYRAAKAWSTSEEGSRPIGYWLTDAGLAPLGQWLRGRTLANVEPPPPWINADFGRAQHLETRDTRRKHERAGTIVATQQRDGFYRAAHGLGAFYTPQASLAFRHPFLSVPLLSFMAALPASLQYSPHCDRLLHRHAMVGLLPDEIRLRSCKGGPNQAIFSGFARSRYWQDMLTEDPLLVSLGFIDREPWRLAVRRFANGETRALRLFLGTAVLEAWLQSLPARWERTAQ